MIALALLAIIVLIIVLQTEWGRDQGKEFIIARLNTLVDGAEFKSDDLTGNFLGGIALLDLELVTAEGEVLVRADTFAARYSLIQLLRNRLKIRNVDLVNPRVWMEQQPDGSWDLFNVIARDDSAVVDTSESWATRLVIELDHLYVGDGQVDARFHSQNDSVLQVRDLYVDLGNAEFGRKPLFELDSLVARFSPPAQDYWANVFAGATLNDSLLVVDGFRLTSPRSNVSAEGSLALPGADSELITDIDFNLTAAPLAFDDVRPFMPGLRQGETLALDLNLGGAQDLLIVDGDARFSDGGTLQVEGSVMASDAFFPFRDGIDNAAAVGIAAVPFYARIAHSSALVEKGKPYFEATQAVGAGHQRVLFFHLLPNIAAPMIIVSSLGVSIAILAAAALSFLGLGAQPPSPEWGAMLSAGRDFFSRAPWLMIFPGVAITITVLGFNLLGDGLQEALDPR